MSDPNKYDLLVQVLEETGNHKAADGVNGLCRMVAWLVEKQVRLEAEIDRLKAAALS